MFFFLIFLLPVLSQDLQIEVVGFNGESSQIFALDFLPQGTVWDSPKALSSKSSGAKIFFKFSRTKEINFLVIQADANDSYIVECIKGLKKDVIWIVPKLPNREGVWIRKKKLNDPVKCKVLVVRPGNGDQMYSVARFYVSREKPRGWEYFQSKVPAITFYVGDPALTVKRIFTLRIALIFVTISVLCIPRKFIRNSFLYILIYCGIVSWFNFGRMHLNRFYHAHDVFHYYVGSKYSPELGYNMLYRCMLRALNEMGIQYPSFVRNLDTNVVVNASEEFEKGEVCRDRFSESRWQNFKKDLTYFSKHLGNFDSVLNDHGYNPTIFWNLFGYAISNLLPANDLTLFYISMVDFSLLVIGGILAYYAFGLQRVAVFVVFWGTNAFADYGWIGNSYMRMDWFALILIGLTFLRFKYYGLAYIFLTLPALFRIFPVFAILGLAIRLFIENRMEFVRLIKYSIGVFLLLLGLEIYLFGGVGHLKDFIQNIKKHSATLSTNHMGLKFMNSYSEESRAFNAKDYSISDHFLTWKSERTKKLKENIFFHYFSIGLLLIGWILVIFKTSIDLYALPIISLLLVQIISASNYYFVFLALMMLLPFNSAFQIFGLCVAGLSHVCYLYFEGYPYDDIYSSMSFLMFGWSVLILGGIILNYWSSKRAGRNSTLLNSLN